MINTAPHRRQAVGADMSGLLLEWYDHNARALPWRVPPAMSRRGVRPDPYHVWLSEVMLQQTTVAAVGRYFRDFVARWPGVRDLAAAEDAQVMGAWAGLGYYARARNLLKCAREVSTRYGGHFPDTYDALITLPGIGPYTGAAIAAIAFDRPEVVVDGNVERVVTRLFAVTDPLPGSKPLLRSHAAVLTPQQRPGDHAQAMMDLGATICTPRNPACPRCPVRERCLAHARGIEAELPRRQPRSARPARTGTAYIARRSDGALLLERRPARGLLGGMLGWPGDPLGETDVVPPPPLPAAWRRLDGEVRHVFTHFSLTMTVWFADVPHEANPGERVFLMPDEFDAAHLPSVMRKAHALAFPHRDLSGG